MRGTAVAAGQVAVIAHPRIFRAERFLANVAIHGAVEFIRFLPREIRHGDDGGEDRLDAACKIAEFRDEPLYAILTAIRLEVR